jgi:PAS domain S-box-containing protein
MPTMPSPETLPFNELVDAAPDGFVVCDRAGKIVLANAQAERMFGYARGELLGQPIHVLIPAALRARHERHVASYTGAPRVRPMGIGMQLVGRRKDGSELPVEISLAPIKTEAPGGELLITAGIRDVSERRRLEDENQRVTGYLVSAVDAVQEAFTLYDEHDRVVLVNSLARQMFADVVRGPIVGQTFDQILAAAVGGGVFEPGEGAREETREQLRERWRAYHRAPAGALEVRSAAGRYLRVTERKTAERGTVSTIADVTEDVERERELRAASAAKSEFLASMSHELRTPLNAILGFAQLLERDLKQPLTARQHDRLKHVMRGGEHLLRLIDDVLDLSRIETGRIAISAEPVDVREVLAEVIATLAPMAERAGITLVPPEWGPGVSERPRVLADRTRLTQILMNFGSNAIKYGRPGGRARFTGALVGPMLRLTVSDDGIGIAAEQQARLFEPFQRAGQETGPIEGTGIGLTIARRLAEMMQARVGFTSEVGRGSEFWVELAPYRQAAADGPAAARVARGSALAAEPARFKIVYVEDNPSNIAFMRDLIEQLASVELITAPNAELGIELVRAHRPDAVILDVNLPGMSGFEAAEQLRASPETRSVPIIGLSAAALPRDAARAKRAGFHRYLTKPVKVAELTEVLEALLLRP